MILFFDGKEDECIDRDAPLNQIRKTYRIIPMCIYTIDSNRTSERLICSLRVA